MQILLTCMILVSCMWKNRWYAGHFDTVRGRYRRTTRRLAVYRLYAACRVDIYRDFF